MTNRNLFAATALLLWTLSFGVQAQGIRMATAEAPPYQLKTGESIKGIAVDVVRCVMDRLSLPYELHLYPWKRNINLLKNNELDLVFSLQPDERLKNDALLSAPLVLEKWYWYGKKQPEGTVPLSARIIALSGSNQAAWLTASGYQSIKTVSNSESALKMVELERADYTLLSQGQYQKAIADGAISPESLVSDFVRFSQMGAYINNRYLEKQPAFLGHFNEQIFNCEPAQVKLGKSDREQLLAAYAKARDFISTPEILSAIAESNQAMANTTQDQIQSLDQQWRKELMQQNRALIDTILARPASETLKAIKNNSQGLYSEIFVVNQHGLNVAMSDTTSDYWQGDEAKFTETFAKQSAEPFIDDIEYDASTRTFQSQISFTLYDGTRPIGVATVGIDVEKALSN